MEIKQLTYIVIPVHEVVGFLQTKIPTVLSGNDLAILLYSLAMVSLYSENMVIHDDSGLYYDILTQSGMEEDSIMELLDDGYGMLYNTAFPYINDIDIFDANNVEYMVEMHGASNLLLTISPTSDG